MSITHKFVSSKSEQPDTTLVGSNEWNANHVIGSGAIQSGAVGSGSVLWNPNLAGKPFVLVTKSGPSDGGDYGPGTAGTQTGGIQEAINALPATGGKVFVKTGQYTLISGIVIPSYTTIEGETRGYAGALGTSLKLGANVNMFQTSGTAAGHTNEICLRNLYLEGGSRAYSGDAIHFQYSSNLLVDNVRIQNFDGSAVYLDSVFNPIIQNLSNDTCGDVAGSKPSIYLGGPQAISDAKIVNIAQSAMKWHGLYIDANCADIQVSNFDSDQGTATAYSHVYIVAGATRLNFDTIDLRTSASGCHIIQDLSTAGGETFWDKIWIGNTVPNTIAVYRGDTGTSIMSNLHVEGTNSGNKLSTGLYISTGTALVNGYEYPNTTTPTFTNNGSGYLCVANMSPLVAPTSISGASPYTYINTDGYKEIVSVYSGNVTSATPSRAGTGWIVSTTGTFELAPNDSITVVYTSAPTMYKLQIP